MSKIKYKLIDRYDYISFDVFDTLVKRTLLTNDKVFDTVANIYKKKFGKELSDFGIKRKRAEILLWKKTSEGEFTLDNIYRKLESFYSAEICSRLKNIELEVENINICQNSEIYPIFEYAKENKKVIIISDMYLSTEILSIILKKAGIDGYIRIYVSGEKKANKSDGSIFDVISQDLDTIKILHMGDSLNGDFIKPRLERWHSIKVTPCLQPYFPKKRSSLSLIDSLVIGLSDSKSLHQGNFWKNFGYSVLGPLLLGFIKWLREEAGKDAIDQIVFLARDGNIIKRAFDLLFDHAFCTDYMYVSRKSVLPAMIEEESELGGVLKKIKFRKEETLKTVFKRLGIEDISEIDNMKIRRKDLYAGKYDDILMPYFPEIKKNMLIQKKYISDYVDKMFHGKKIAVVDVGWNGTIQDCLQHVSKKNIKGYYLGLENTADQSKKAFFQKFNPNIIPYTRGVFETCFSAIHPSNRAYECLNNKIVPVFESCEYSSDTKMKMQNLQDSALEFIETYKKISKELMLDDECLDNELISNMFIDFCVNPKKKDAEQFGDIEFNDITNRKLIDFKHGKTLFNLKAFMDSDWKAGYVKAILGGGIPYGKVLVFLNSFRKKV